MQVPLSWNANTLLVLLSESAEYNQRVLSITISFGIVDINGILAAELISSKGSKTKMKKRISESPFYSSVQGGNTD